MTKSKIGYENIIDGYKKNGTEGIKQIVGSNHIAPSDFNRSIVFIGKERNFDLVEWMINQPQFKYTKELNGVLGIIEDETLLDKFWSIVNIDSNDMRTITDIFETSLLRRNYNAFKQLFEELEVELLLVNLCFLFLGEERKNNNEDIFEFLFNDEIIVETINRDFDIFLKDFGEFVTMNGEGIRFEIYEKIEKTLTKYLNDVQLRIVLKDIFICSIIENNSDYLHYTLNHNKINFQSINAYETDVVLWASGEILSALVESKKLDLAKSNNKLLKNIVAIYGGNEYEYEYIEQLQVLCTDENVQREVLKSKQLEFLKFFPNEIKNKEIYDEMMKYPEKLI